MPFLMSGMASSDRTYTLFDFSDKRNMRAGLQLSGVMANDSGSGFLIARGRLQPAMAR
jgi:hypothetical protein